MNTSFNSPATREYRFGDCRIDVSRREIWRDGGQVSIEPKAYDLLVYLIENRDRAVDKNELQDRIWPGVVVTEAALTRCVMKARRAIGDTRREDGLIRTVRGHGYRFSAEVDGLSQPAVDSASIRPSIAILPFRNLSDDPQQEYFADGITEDIITELSRFRSLFVIASHSSFSFKEQDLPTAEIAAALGVQFIAEGSVQRAGERIRVNARLVDVPSAAQVWSERYDREIQDILQLQEEVAAKIAATIGGRVEASRGRPRLSPQAVESYDCVLRAQALYYQVDREASEEARTLLEEALAKDPDNARALALLAAVWSMASWSFWAKDNEKAQELSLEYGRRAIELDSSDSLAHALYGEILFDADKNEQAEYHFQRAIELNPNDIAARALYAAKLAAMSRIDDSIAQLSIAEQLDPFGLFWIPWIKSQVMFAARRFEDAVQALASLSKPPNEARYILAAALARLGRVDEARQQIDAFLAQARKDMPDYPGDKLANWRPIFGRMLDYDSEEDLDFVVESLELAGWE